jgi:glycosyl transferase family 87
MSEADGGRATLLMERAPTALVVGLVAVRVLVLVFVVVDAARNPITDVDVLRAERIATSPARPYQDFAVEYMPLETGVIELLAGDGPRPTLTRFALLAFAGDLAAAAAVAFGWGRRAAIVYLLLGLPLLAFLYLRFDPVVVALATWAVALERRRRSEAATGMVFGLAIMAKLWPVVLLPLLWLRRRWTALMSSAAILLVGGALWYVWGGPKGPLQVLTFRGAVGWSVESTVGDLLWIFTDRQTGLEAGVIRIGVIPTWAKAVLFLALVAVEIALWRRAREDRDPAGGTALAAVTALLIFSPLFSIQYAVWLLPWAAVAAGGDRAERRVATLAAFAVAICGLVGLSYMNAAPFTHTAEKWILFGRNAACIALVASWLARPRRESPSEPAWATPPASRRGEVV